MTKLTAESSIADIAACFNELNGSSTDVKTLAKRGKAKLLAQIEALEAKLPPEEPKAEEPSAFAKSLMQLGAKSEPAKSEKPKRVKKATTEKKEKGPVIRVEAEKLLLEVVKVDEDKRPWGHSYEYILSTLLAQFEGAKTTVACLRWYAVHMRERGEKVPSRPRASAKAE